MNISKVELKSYKAIIISAILYGLISPRVGNTSIISLLTAISSLFFILPFFDTAINDKGKSRIFKLWLWGALSTISGRWWIPSLIVVDNQALGLAAVFMIAFYLGTWSIFSGYLIGKIVKDHYKYALLLVPAVWVFIDFLRTLGDLSFPWMFEGYLFTQYLWLSQIASITGIWGLTYLLILISFTIYKLYKKEITITKSRNILLLSLSPILLWGFFTVHFETTGRTNYRIAVIQPNINDGDWDGRVSLDTTLNAIDSLITESDSKPNNLVIMPESALYCYLNRRPSTRRRVNGWSSRNGSDILSGTLEYNRIDNKRTVYNAVYLIRDKKPTLKYYKHKLVPFGETIPFQGIFPALSGIDLGEADFARGTEESVWQLDSSISVAPLVCYEAIYPNFVRKRVTNGANILVNVTNDGWFSDKSFIYKHSFGPDQHGTMAQMRAIENGVPIFRSANAGVSMAVDGYGRILKRTDVGSRTYFTETAPKARKSTIYRKFGDWFVALMIIMIVGAYAIKLYKK